ncbi:hypothetical protein [Lederbergia citri]|uniref:Uncharacterized protein n=1 Tax=Lederbergia citri TaxID=2833580 RepID=A0A942YFR6_9BACI|nr:hypothetical protein [Lederbergia citri]MBS4195333.1 hypothetical protein [Lederbergia citri]
MNNQARLDAIFERLAQQYGKLNEKQQAYAIREIGRIRGELADLLADYADSDGNIKRTRINRLMRDLDDIEKQIRKYGTVALDEIIKDSAAWTTTKVNGALNSIVGATVTASTFDRINRDVFRYVVNRYGDDGLVLSDRIWSISADIREEISAVLRSGIIRGEGVSTMIPKVRRVHDNETWKIRRLVQTEGSTAYRTATAYNAERSDVVQWVQINDRPGMHRNHDKHRCFILANEDRYREGPGIFKPTDSEIYSPHPNCTSFITYVLDERWL